LLSCVEISSLNGVSSCVKIFFTSGIFLVLLEGKIAIPLLET
jgi:hypothetical protein